MKTRWHLLALAAVALLVGLLFLQEPGFGDDLTYWSFAFDLRERGLEAWQRHSFHDLRWPVWGVCWVLQSLCGVGLASYYGEPLLYLVGGAWLGFAFGKKLTQSVIVAWACGIAFLFHPLLDSVSYRPMPDLSEGVWGAAVMLAWWGLMNAPSRNRALLCAAAMGTSIFVIEANRVTGVFIVPVTILCTLLFFPRRFGWLIAAGVVAATLYVGQSVFYHRLFGDWLHDLTANAGNAGAKGTEFPHPLTLPFRFLDTLCKGNPLAPVYCIFAAAGAWIAWRRHGVLGRVIVVWFGALFFIYSCAPQSLWPYRPLVRDADRFLAALAVPMAVLASLGLMACCAWIAQRSKLAAGDARRPIMTGVFLTGLLFAVTTRDRFDVGFVPEMRRYLDSLPEGTRVFTHKAMREIVFLVDAPAARRLAWTAPNEIMHRSDQLEAQAAGCTEFWYARKLTWLNTRKTLEKRSTDRQPTLGSYFDAPDRDWTLTRLFAKGDNPDFVFYRRRQPDSPPAEVLGPEAPAWQQLIPVFPACLNRENPLVQTNWHVAPNLKGKLVRFEFEAASRQVEAMTIRVKFHTPNAPKTPRDYLLKPYLYGGGGKEFFVLPIPADADTCHVQLKLSRSGKEVVFTSFRAVVEKAGNSSL